MWELSQVAKESAARRTAIFQDIDRKDGPMWSQIYGICMDAVKGIETRVDNYGKPPPAPPAPAPEEPRARVSAPLRDDPIFNSKSGPTTLRNGVGKAVGQITQSPGVSPMSKLSPLAKKRFKDLTDRVLNTEQQASVSPDHMMGQVRQAGLWLMGYEYFGAMFRHEFRSEFAATVLGTPYAEPTLYANAIAALAQLGAHSLTEDEFGNVHRDVPSIIRTLTAVIKKVEALKLRFPVHWTDAKGIRSSPEVDQVLDAARAGLDQVVSKFEPYSTDLRLSLTDIRLAKEAAAKPQQTKPQEVKPKAVEKSESKRVRRREDKRPEMEQVR